MKKNIKAIENNESEYDYYLNTMEILEKYYGENNENTRIVKTQKKKSEMTIIEYINDYDKNDISMKKFIKEETKLSRKKINKIMLIMLLIILSVIIVMLKKVLLLMNHYMFVKLVENVILLLLKLKKLLIKTILLKIIILVIKDIIISLNG